MASSTKIVITLSALSLLHLLPFSAAQTPAVNGGYWFPESGFPADNINATLFTHLFCAFAGLNPETNEVYIPSSDNDSFAQFTPTVTAQNPSVITLLSIGGGSANRSVFAAMAADYDSRQSFINSSIILARSYGFSGMDLDWEYPDTDTDMTNLGTLLTEWRQAINDEASDAGAAALLLTAAFYYSSNLNGMDYPAQAINSSLDWVNVMDYDFYDPSWYNFTISHAVLYNPPSPTICGSYGIGQWIQAGVSVSKLALGVPFYGYAFLLENASDNGILAPAAGPAGPDSGVMEYSEIISFIIQNNLTPEYNSTFVMNYCYSGTTWIGYDDVEAIDAKVSYAKAEGLLGYFAWHVGADDNWTLSNQAKQSWGS